MTNPLVQAIDERIKTRRADTRHECSEVVADELEELKQLAIAEQERIVKTLEERTLYWKEIDGGNMDDWLQGMEEAFQEAIEIVKGE